MKRFPYAHATHPQWRMAAALVLAQLRAQMALPGHASQPSLGLLYITDHYAADAQDILDHLGAELPEVTDWAGTVGVGIASNNVEYIDEPALAVMLCDLAPHQYRVFSGVAPLAATQTADGFVPQTALVHADGATPDVADLIAEMAQRTASHYVFGGLAASRGPTVQFARSSHGALAGSGRRGAAGVFHGGLSGVAFGPEVRLLSRVTQGVRPLAPAHRIDRADHHVVLRLDDRPALDVLLQDLAITLDEPPAAVQRLRQTLVGLTAPHTPQPRGVQVPGALGDDVLVRHVIGLDPARRGVAIADTVPEGGRLVFCERHVQAARADLMRICAEIREELEPATLQTADMVAAPAPAERIVGAVYVSCSGRGGPHFGGPSAELQIVRHALGDVPLVGFFAGGEIAHHRLYGYTGVLTVFTAEETAKPSVES
jgi:small ligand-binding sensory domain FIST